MTAQEKCIIETILADIGLEPLYVGDNEDETQNKHDRMIQMT